MVQNHFSLTWDSYKSSICSGFSSLQQNGEFVDMTLAADGHLVKVHQVLIALASPYLKELINSVPNQHPVIFLNNVPHTTLALLLEYIYTGEVLVPAKYLQSFIESAKALHIKGLDSVSSSYYTNIKGAQSNDSATVTPASRGLPIDVHSVQTAYNLPADAMKVSVRAEPQACNIISVKAETQRSKDEYHSYSDHAMEASADNDCDDDLQISNDGADANNQRKGDTDNENSMLELPDPTQMSIQDKVSSNTLQFTVSIRGSLQVILNRYMYNLQSTAQHSGVRRWRCIDYRNKKCPATLITKGNVVMRRACLHSHLYHDKKILAKIEKNAVYSALDDVEGYKEKEKKSDDDEEWPVDSSGFMALEADLSDSSPSKTRGS